MHLIFAKILIWLRWFCFKIITSGRIPNHIGIIMDGNRRYGEKYMNDKRKGHNRGCDKLIDTINWCIELGIKEITAYAFSIENFKRSEDEKQYLMNLFKETFLEKKMDNTSVHINLFGDLTLLPSETRGYLVAIHRESASKETCKIILNIAVSYTSRDEIQNAVKTIVRGVENTDICRKDISPSLISQCLYTNRSLDLDLLIRTSGEIRLSDFLLWQVSASYMQFDNVLWPSYEWHYLLMAIFLYQRTYKELQAVKQAVDNNEQTLLSDRQKMRVSKFITKVNKLRDKKMEDYYFKDYKSRDVVNYNN